MSRPTIEFIFTVRIHTMTARHVRDLRVALIGCVPGPTVLLVVDLRTMDDRHDITVYALLAEKARTSTLADGNMTAIGPSPRLRQLLVASGIPVAREALIPHQTARCEEISIGALAA
jgi:hypothetical protein